MTGLCWNVRHRCGSEMPSSCRANVTNISLIAKGTIDGQRRSLLYRPATDNYVTDKTGVGPFTHAELVAQLTAGDTLTIMGVPPVSGMRMGIDRDWNGVLDGDETPPSLMAVRSDTGVTISWPINTAERRPGIQRRSLTAELEDRHQRSEGG